MEKITLIGNSIKSLVLITSAGVKSYTVGLDRINGTIITKIEYNSGIFILDDLYLQGKYTILGNGKLLATVSEMCNLNIEYE